MNEAERNQQAAAGRPSSRGQNVRQPRARPELSAFDEMIMRAGGRPGLAPVDAAFSIFEHSLPGEGTVAPLAPGPTTPIPAPATPPFSYEELVHGATRPESEILDAGQAALEKLRGWIDGLDADDEARPFLENMAGSSDKDSVEQPDFSDTVQTGIDYIAGLFSDPDLEEEDRPFLESLLGRSDAAVPVPRPSPRRATAAVVGPSPSAPAANAAPTAAHLPKVPPRRHIEPPVGPSGDPMVTFINDDPNGPQTNLRVNPKAAQAIEDVMSRFGHKININSTTGGGRKPPSPHLHGRGLDVNRIDGMRVDDPAASKVVGEFQQEFFDNPNVTQVFGPVYNVEISGPPGQRVIRHLDRTIERDRRLIEGHTNHIHITTTQ